MFWPFKTKEVSLEDYLHKTKKIKINGVVFQIKKINLDDHLSGLDVILQIRDLYRKEKNQPAAVTIENQKKISKIVRDIIYAGVVKPQLTMKKDEPTKIHIDEIMVEKDMAEALSTAILQHTYQKKR